jgi:hypothetical protein
MAQIFHPSFDFGGGSDGGIGLRQEPLVGCSRHIMAECTQTLPQVT